MAEATRQNATGATKHTPRTLSLANSRTPPMTMLKLAITAHPRLVGRRSVLCGRPENAQRTHSRASRETLSGMNV